MLVSYHSVSQRFAFFLELSRNVSVWKCFVFTLYNPFIYLWNRNIIYPILVESTSRKAIGMGSAPLTYTQSKYLKPAKLYSLYENPKACLNQVTLGSDVCLMKGPAENPNQEVCPKKGPADLKLLMICLIFFLTTTAMWLIPLMRIDEPTNHISHIRSFATVNTK